MEEDSECRQLRAAWRSSCIYDGPVEIIALAGGGGSRPHQVRLGGGCMAYAKRAFNASGVPEGANEFIASEIALRLEVPVPPVGFWTDPGDVRHAISVRAFAEPITWGEVLPQLTVPLPSTLIETFAKAWVFHTWIADSDHRTSEPDGQDGDRLDIARAWCMDRLRTRLRTRYFDWLADPDPKPNEPREQVDAVRKAA